MPGIDETRTFVPLNIAVLTISDTRELSNDKSGDTLVERLQTAGHRLAGRAIVKDEIEAIRAAVKGWAADAGVDVILTTGGTGVTGRDVTPEALEPIFDKHIAGFGELFRMLSYKLIGSSTIQSRATAGVISHTYVFACPGSPGACRDAWDLILAEQLDARFRPCNFADMMPRLKE